MTKRSQPPLSEITAGRSELAGAFGLTGSRISQLVREGVLPAPTGHGQFPLVECFQRYTAYQREGTGGDRMKLAGEFSAARADWMKARARKAALEEKALSDEFVSVADMDTAWCAIGANLRTRYLGVPNRLAAQFSMLQSPQAVFDIAMREINEVLEELQRTDANKLFVEIFGEPDGDEKNTNA